MLEKIVFGAAVGFIGALTLGAPPLTALVGIVAATALGVSVEIIRFRRCRARLGTDC